MNKDVKKAMSMIDEKEEKRREKLVKAEAEAASTREQLEKLKEAMTTAESSEQYKEILKEKRDLEAVLEFCEKRIKEANSETITPAEYKAVMMETQKAFNTLKEEKRAAIREEISKLLKLFYSFDTEVTELNKVIQKAAHLHRTNPIFLDYNTISGDDTELREFTSAFSRVKTAAELKERLNGNN